jgi:TolB-like protein/Tfp pilus assembly protein PilF
MSGFYSELKRRNVARVGVAYLVIAWLLLQIADTMTSALKLPEWVSPLVILVLAIGFIPILVFTWIFEITPDGVVRTKDIHTDQPTSSKSDRRLDYATIAVVLAAVAFLAAAAFLAWTRFGAESELSGDPAVFEASVAVLPFVNMSGQEENEYFSDGLTETLLHMLAQNPDLRVSARTSSFAFKNKNLDVREIASDLGVAHVLEGSVQRVGDNIRITAQLIRASDGIHLWSEKYDRKLDVIFAIHDEIALAVGAELSKLILGDSDLIIPEGLATRNVDAYDLYLRALPETIIASFESMRNAEELLKNALVIDPTFTDAKALLAKNYVSLADLGAMDYDEGTAQAIALYEQVLTEQPTHVGARGFLMIEEVAQTMDSGNHGAALSAAIEQFLDLVNDAPNSVEARMYFANILGSNSMHDEAIEQYQEAIKLDPLNPFPHEMLAGIYARLRQWDKAREELTRALEIEPRQPNVVAALAPIFLKTGDAVGYIRQLQKTIEINALDYEMPYAIAKLLYELKLFEEGDRFKSQVFAIAPNSPAAQALKIVRAIRADSEAESLEVARQLIRDDAENRLHAWIRAFRHLMLTAVLRGRTQDELEFVQEYWPDFANWEVEPGAWKVGLGRAHTLEIWRDLDTEQGVLDRVDRVVKGFATLNLPLSRVQIVHIDVLLLQDDLEEAIDAALTNLFSHSVLEHLNIKDRFVTPLYADFVADPRIASAQNRWNDELAVNREEVREYLADNE